MIIYNLLSCYKDIMSKGMIWNCEVEKNVNWYFNLSFWDFLGYC